MRRPYAALGCDTARAHMTRTCTAMVAGRGMPRPLLRCGAVVSLGAKQMSQLRIYGIARTRAFRVLWVAKELGLPYEHIPVEIGEAGAHKPEYLAINPNGRLPAIDDDGLVLWESLAITLYLAKKHSAGRLYPADRHDEARTWQWTLWALNEV